jgi:hypothetical protein
MTWDVVLVILLIPRTNPPYKFASDRPCFQGDRPCFQGGQHRPDNFGRERRELPVISPRSDAAEVVLLGEVLKLGWRGPTPSLRVTLG